MENASSHIAVCRVWKGNLAFNTRESFASFKSLTADAANLHLFKLKSGSSGCGVSPAVPPR